MYRALSMGGGRQDRHTGSTEGPEVISYGLGAYGDSQHTFRK